MWRVFNDLAPSCLLIVWQAFLSLTKSILLIKLIHHLFSRMDQTSGETISISTQKSILSSIFLFFIMKFGIISIMIHNFNNVLQEFVGRIATEMASCFLGWFYARARTYIYIYIWPRSKIGHFRTIETRLLSPGRMNPSLLIQIYSLIATQRIGFNVNGKVYMMSAIIHEKGSSKRPNERNYAQILVWSSLIKWP